MKRIADMNRKTKETDIKIELNLDGTGKNEINTGIGYFDHMLCAFAIHSEIDLNIKAIGDLQVDTHHTIEDVGIVIGQCIKNALKNSESIERYGNFFCPMDEALASCHMDISGRAFLVFNADFEFQYCGQMETQMVEEFFRALAMNSGITLHLNVLYGKNDHHKIEALFKAFAHAFKEAKMLRKGGEILSSKGVL